MKKKEQNNLQYLEDIVVKTKQLIPAFRMAYKNGDIDLFLEFIKKNNLQESFLEDTFNACMELYNFEDEKKCYLRLVKEEGLQYLSNVYGEKFGEKLKLLYKNRRLDAFDISQLVQLNRREDIAQQADIMCELIDLFANDELDIGIHRTGGKGLGEKINSTGLILTGHISSGADSSRYTDIHSKLEENISFAYNHFGLLMLMIATGGNYKNHMDSELIDINIIAIPEKDIEHEKEDIILNDDCLRLNPKYIKGYVTVNSRDNTMVKYVENPRYIEPSKDGKRNLLADVIEESKKQLGWSSIQGIVQKVKNKINGRIRNSGEEFDDR